MDKASTGWKILSFLLPLIGIILYFVWKGENPVSAKEVLQWGLIGFATYTFGTVILIILSLPAL